MTFGKKLQLVDKSIEAFIEMNFIIVTCFERFIGTFIETSGLVVEWHTDRTEVSESNKGLAVAHSRFGFGFENQE